MTMSTSGNTIGTPNTAVPGVVLAVSPNNSELLINDQVRQIFYLYNISGGSATTFGGMGTAAAWTPDSDTLYIVDSAAQNSTPANIAAGITGHTDTLYVYNASTGWISSCWPTSTIWSSRTVIQLGRHLARRAWRLPSPAWARFSAAAPPWPTPGALPAQWATTPA
jgi:hypothetical protein